MAWIAVCQKFFEAYVNFRVEGTAKHCIEHNDRNIEISFFDHGYNTSVELYCSKIHNGCMGFYNGTLRNTEKLIRMILWLALDVEEPDVYNIKASDPEEEYKELGDILVERYRNCYENELEEYWKGVGEVRFILKFHNRRILVFFYADPSWEPYCGYVNVDVHCLDTDLICTTFINQEEDNPDYLINLIQDMSLEPEITEFSITDSTREHDLIKEALIGRQIYNGPYIYRWPFKAHTLFWESETITDRYIILHKRRIRIQFNQKQNSLDITLNCLTTGKSYSLELPQTSSDEIMEEVCEELVYKIQELAWEFI